MTLFNVTVRSLIRNRGNLTDDTTWPPRVHLGTFVKYVLTVVTFLFNGLFKTTICKYDFEDLDKAHIDNGTIRTI